MILILGHLTNPVALFLLGAIVACVLEYLTSYGMEKLFHARWWDYSKQPFNFRGYICLEFSLIWGFAILFVVRIFQKYIDKLITGHDSSVLGWTILVILYVVYFVDFVVQNMYTIKCKNSSDISTNQQTKQTHF